MGEAPAPQVVTDAGLAELEQRIGRNLLTYQRVEQAMKRLLVGSVLDSSVDSLSSRIAQQAARVARLNMGDAAREVFERVLTATPQIAAARPDPTQVTVSIRMSMAPGNARPDEFEQLQADCKAIVAQRNDMVHHLLRQHDLASKAGVMRAFQALDEHHAAADALRVRLERLADINATARRQLGQWLASDQGQEAVDVALAHGRVVEVLTEVAQHECRPDGWAYVTTARHRLKSSAAEEMTRLQKAWGKAWFKRSLDLAVDLLEQGSEPMPDGDPKASRELYRVRQPSAVNSKYVPLTHAPSQSQDRQP